jgi:hypothetical protein
MFGYFTSTTGNLLQWIEASGLSRWTVVLLVIGFLPDPRHVHGTSSAIIVLTVPT